MRLPLLLPTDLTAGQRPMYDSFEKMVQAREYSGFEVRNPEGAYIGPWGVFVQFPELSKPLIDFINLAQKLPGLSERARQVVILAIGGQFNVAYELYAHDPLALSAGLRVDQIGALSAGARPADLSEDELLAFDVTKALVGGAGPVPGPLNRFQRLLIAAWRLRGSAAWRLRGSAAWPARSTPGRPGG